MMTTRRPLIAIFFTCTLAACTSKVSTTLSPEEMKASDAKPASSSVELLEIVGRSETPTCSPQNKVRILVTQNSERAIKCRDNTRRNPTLNAGAVCPAGVSVPDFTSVTDWGDCATVKICGQSPKVARDLASSPQARMQQLDFSALPWGCRGSLEWAFADQTGDPGQIKKIEIDIAPPPCPTCAATATPTCEICGVDNGKPVISEVLGEIADCNQIRVIVFAEDRESGLHRDAYSFDGGATWQSSSEFVFNAMALNLAADKVRVRDRAGNVALGTRNVNLTAPPCPCDAPWGERIPHGESRQTFKVGAVQCNQTCDTQTVTRTCNNGVLSGDSGFKFNSCKIEGCPKCNLPWGEQIAHGESATAYEKSSVSCADQCKSTTLKCERGILSGDATNFRAKACAFSKPKCNCEFAGVIIANGASKTVFAKSEPACGETCTSGTVKCTEGSLSGDIAMTNLTCNPKECKCTTAWGQKLELNEEVAAYKTATLTCAQTIGCDDPSNMIKIKCTDVTKNTLTVTQGAGNVGDFSKSACSSPVCACTHLGVSFKPTDPDLKVYKFEISSPPTTCAGQGNFGYVKCVQSGSVFKVQGDTNTSVYKYTRCEDPPGGGKSTETVGPGTGGGTGGGLGNDEGEGEGFRRRGGGSSESKPCDVNSYPYVCGIHYTNAAMTSGSGCYLPGPDGPLAPPTDPKDITRRVGSGAYVAAYSKKTVACGDSCSKYASFIYCGRGGWQNLDKYPYQECKEVCP